jgi:uncharacterized protein
MQAFISVIKQMINISGDEEHDFLSRCFNKQFRRNEILSRPGVVPNEIFFICKGLVRFVVTDKEGVEDSIHFALENQFGLNIGLLINNAGFGTSGLFTESSLHEEINMVRVNCEVVLSLTHYFAQKLKQQKRGGIIFLSSLVAFQGVPNAANYAATKAYIQSFAEALTVELKPFGVSVLTAAPGPVETGFGQRANMKMGKVLRPDQLGVPILNALGKQTNVIPGLLSKVLVYSLRTVPRFLKVKIMQQVMGGFTKHQRA